MVLPISLKVRRNAAGLSVLSVTVHRRLLLARTAYWVSLTITPARDGSVNALLTPGSTSMVAPLMARTCA
jgi:hypothetical protein